MCSKFKDEPTFQRSWSPEDQQALETVAKKIGVNLQADNLAGEQASFASIEAAASKMGQAVTRHVMEQLAIQQTQLLDQDQPCPTCQKLCSVKVNDRTLRYLSNNACRMDYPSYWRLGLPVASSMVESLIKEFNYRVKGSEKSWKRPSGCEPVLQVRNAVLCEDADRLSDFILSRPGSAYYRPSTSKRASEATAVAA